MSEQNKAIVRRYFEEIESQGNFEAVQEIFTADWVGHDPFNEDDTRGHDGLMEEISMYRSAFPDLRYTVEDQVAEGDRVASRWTARGTHSGEAMGLAPSGKRITVTGMAIDRFADGRIQESWWNWDTLGFMQQIGAVPAEQPA